MGARWQVSKITAFGTWIPPGLTKCEQCDGRHKPWRTCDGVSTLDPLSGCRRTPMQLKRAQERAGGRH